MLLEDVFDMATGSVVKRSCFGFADKFGFTPSSVLVCVRMFPTAMFCALCRRLLSCVVDKLIDTKAKMLIKVVTKWLILYMFHLSFFTTASSLTDFSGISAVFCVFVVSFLVSESGLLQYYKYISTLE